MGALFLALAEQPQELQDGGERGGDVGERAGAQDAARAGALAAAADPKAGAAERAEAENKLSRALVNLQATAEAYPQLQANQNFMDLQNQLSQLEQKIAYARQFYNDVVMKFNTAIETVPSNIIAGLFHFTQAQYFEADEQSRQVPQVSFSK